jgi:kynurenine formamidase
MWVDISQPLYDGMAHLDVHPSPSFEGLYNLADHGASVTEFSLVTHVGTHVDAPTHFCPDGATIDEIPLETFHGEAAVVDVSRAEPEAITVTDIESADVEIRSGDIVLLYTGWGSKFGTEEYDPHPWLAEGVADYLVERDVKLVALDAFSPDRPSAYQPDGWDEYPIHRELLGNGVLIAENVCSLDRIADRRVTVSAFPVKIRDGDGAQARFVARE